MQKLMVIPFKEKENDDLKLMERIKEGDEDALRILMESKIDKLHSFCTRLIGDREEAKDLCQMVFLKIWEQADRFNPSFTLNTWLYKIAYNLCIDTLRHKKSVDQMEKRYLEAVRVEKKTVSPLSELEQEEIERILKELSSELTPKQRAVFILHEIDEISTPEIAKILKSSQATIRNHLFHARKIITEKLKEKYPEYADERL